MEVQVSSSLSFYELTKQCDHVHVMQPEAGGRVTWQCSFLVLDFLSYSIEHLFGTNRGCCHFSSDNLIMQKERFM